MLSPIRDENKKLRISYEGIPNFKRLQKISKKPQKNNILSIENNNSAIQKKSDQYELVKV